MSILFVSQIAPYPPNGGEKIRSYGILRLLSSMNYKIHAIVGAGGDIKKLESKVHNIKCYEFDFTGIYSTNRLRNYCNAFRVNSKLSDLILRILDANPIDIVLIDYNFYGQHIHLFKKRSIPVIYGTHNAQAQLVHQKPAQTFKEKFWRLADFIIYRMHEMLFFRNADALITVSENDREYHKSVIQEDRIFVIPNFLDESEYENTASGIKEDYIIMAGNFQVFQNFHGLKWFISEIWNKELSSITRLVLAGIGSKESLEALSIDYSTERISATGPLDDLKPIISRARAAVVPLLHGSGSRLKCIEAMALKTQIISTSKGAEGIEHDHSIIIADSPELFRKGIVDVIEGIQDHTEKAYAVFSGKYSLNSNRIVFNQIVRKITNRDKI